MLHILSFTNATVPITTSISDHHDPQPQDYAAYDSLACSSTAFPAKQPTHSHNGVHYPNRKKYITSMGGIFATKQDGSE
jgi:hypothetical protein